MAQVSIPTTVSDVLHLTAFLSFFVVAAIFSPCNSAYLFAKLQPRLSRGIQGHVAENSLAKPIISTASWILLLLTNLAVEYSFLPVAFGLVSSNHRRRCPAGAKNCIETIDFVELSGMVLLIALVPFHIWQAVVGCALLQDDTPSNKRINSTSWQLWGVMITGGILGFLLTWGMDFARI